MPLEAQIRADSKRRENPAQQELPKSHCNSCSRNKTKADRGVE
jgi:hypothetical protein